MAIDRRRSSAPDELFPANEVAAPHTIAWIWVVYVLLFALSIPWYVRDPAPRVWLGLPHWVLLSLTAVFGVALFTAFVVWRYWPQTDVESRSAGRNTA
jgi:hypothetical protein